MLAFQNQHPKRAREDDSDSDEERYLKRSRPRDLQSNCGFSKCPSSFSASTSPPPVVPGLEAMTPAESEPSDADSPASIPEEPLMIMSPHNDMDYAMHMDDNESDRISSQPPDSPFVANFRPAKLNFHLFNRDPAPDISSRIPTPIYPTFNTGGMGGLGYPSSGLAGGMATSNTFLGVPSSDPQAMPISHRRQRSQDRNIRMPSPISEDEDIPDTPTALTQSQLSRLSVTTHHSSDRMDTEMGAPAATPTRGRKRSGALTGIGRFSMGYRDDCEKCRLRVPGHYSHFL